MARALRAWAIKGREKLGPKLAIQTSHSANKRCVLQMLTVKTLTIKGLLSSINIFPVLIGVNKERQLKYNTNKIMLIHNNTEKIIQMTKSCFLYPVQVFLTSSKTTTVIDQISTHARVYKRPPPFSHRNSCTGYSSKKYLQ